MMPTVQPQSPISNYMVGNVILGLVGFIMLLAFDFAGTYNYGYYVETWYDINAWNNPGGYLIIIPIAVGLLYCAYISASAMRAIGPETPGLMRRGFLITTASFVVLLIVGIGFAAYCIAEDLSDWWFDAGFYGGFIASLIMLILFRMASNSFGPPAAPIPPGAPGVAPVPGMPPPMQGQPPPARAPMVQPPQQGPPTYPPRQGPPPGGR